MFSDDILEAIFSQTEVHKVPLEFQTIMVKAVEVALEQEDQKNVNEFQSNSISDT